MEELHAVADDQSHYEISLTAGQAFAAFVLLLLSLAASFAFGLMIGKGQADDRLVVRRETPVVTEAAVVSTKADGRIVELGVQADEFEDPSAPEPARSAAEIAAPAVVEEAGPVATESNAAVEVTSVAAVAPAPQPGASAAPGRNVTGQASHPSPRLVTYAQLLSTADQKTAENLAVRLIDRGFTAAYVERGATEKGAIYRVRVKFDSEQAARAAESRLKEFSKEVWITSR